MTARPNVPSKTRCQTRYATRFSAGNRRYSHLANRV